MISAPLHPQEQKRLEELLRYEVLDTETEAALDELTQLASAICGTSISLVSLVDKDRQWFKSKVGLDASQTDREIAFCSHAILQEGVFEIPNASLDERFHDNPLVTGAPDIRFYAGAPLVTPSGMPIGTLCVIDPNPKKLTPQQEQALSTLANQVISQLELRLHNHQLRRMQQEQEQFFAVMAHDLRSPFNGILGLSKMLHQKAASLTPDKLSVMANGILESSLKVYQLLDEMLQWSRNRLGAIKIEKENVAMIPLVMDTVKFMDDAFSLKNIQLVENLADNTMAFTDDDLCKTILRNLLANAIKYSPEGGTVTLDLCREQDGVTLSVTDQGPGLSDELKASLFSNTVKSMAGSHGEVGLGIGLRLCRDFALQIDGELTLKETQQPGACFVLTLPNKHK